MPAAKDIKITKITKSKINDLDWNNLPFGKYFTDYMLEADYANGEWVSVAIKPYQPLTLDPALTALHYGQSIFEGIKAYNNVDGETYIFRPHENLIRFNKSADRMCMPEVPEWLFIDGMRQLIELEKQWIPNKENHALYVRPFMFSTDALLGVRPSLTYKFMILLSPTGPYFAAPMKIFVEEKYTRAAPGGVGFSKNAGNYGGSLRAATEAQKMGYDQVLWTDAHEHKWLQEVGMMNVFFLIDNKAITPSLEEGTILKGVTRDSVITVLNDLGISVEERPINIEELVQAYESGRLQEVFGTGTAATIALIQELFYNGKQMLFDVQQCEIANQVKNILNEVRYGLLPDTHNWLVKV